MTTSPTTTPATAGTIALVPVRYLRESPFNPRKQYSQAALQERADSIQAQGMLQPIVARDLPAGQQDIWVRHEIVFGHRRFRAAQLAGLDAVPVVLRPFTDEQAALAQVAENLQRQDVTALEEADSFARLHSVHGMTADAIAAGVNKSRSYVYGRLKLAKMAPEVRAAVQDDGLPPDIAIEIARFADHALQKKALKDTKAWAYGEAWPSVREAARRLRGMFSCDIEQAAFDPEDITLVRSAGACSTCPKRAGNDPDLQGVLDAGVCTDSECFGWKARAHIKIELILLRNQGHKVIDGEDAAALSLNQWASPKGYASVKDGTWVEGAGDDGDGDRMDYEAMLILLQERGLAAPKTTAITIKGDTALRHFLTHAEVDDVVARVRALLSPPDDKGTPTPSTAGASAHMGAGVANLDDWTPAELVVRSGGWMRVKEAVMRNLLSLPRTADDMRAILLREYDQADGFGPISETMGLDAEMDAAEKAWDDDATATEPFSYRAWWEVRLSTLSPDQLAALMLGAALWDLLGYGGASSRASAARRVALAERYGVDVVAAAQPEQMDGAGVAGGRGAKASAPEGTQLDAFAGAGA